MANSVAPGLQVAGMVPPGRAHFCQAHYLFRRPSQKACPLPTPRCLPLWPALPKVSMSFKNPGSSTPNPQRCGQRSVGPAQG